MDRLYSRRSIVRRGVALAGGLGGLTALVTPGWAKKRRRHHHHHRHHPKFLNVWRLDPNWGPCPKGHPSTDCSACHACHVHAKNKRFATRKAADKGRAHPHCKCIVKRGGKISWSAYVKLFGRPGNLKRTSIDLRNANDLKTFRAGRP